MTGSALQNSKGIVVAIVGPDGVGKSTLAAGIEARAAATGTPCRRLHSRPRLLPEPGRIMHRSAGGGADDPHGRSPSGRAVSLLRLLYLAADFAFGWRPRVLRWSGRGELVVIERCALDIVVDPHRYRIALSDRLVRAITRWLPRPDLTLVLDGPPELVHSRKRELSLDELQRQREAWRAFARSAPLQYAVIDATAPGENVLDHAWDAVVSARDGRRLDIAPAWSPRFAVSPGNAPSAAGLVRAGGRRHAMALSGFEAALRLRMPGLVRRDGASIPREIAEAVHAALGIRDAEIAIALPRRGDPRGRFTVAVTRDGAMLAYAKVSDDRDALAYERRVLEELARIDTASFVAPAELGWTELGSGRAMLLLEPLGGSGANRRPLGGPELNALVELSELGHHLRGVVRGEGSVIVHGDFAPWNCAHRIGSKQGLALWDWEDARFGEPLDDFFHWQLVQSALLGKPTLAEVAANAVNPDPDTTLMLGRLGIDVAEVPSRLSDYASRTGRTGRHAVASRRVQSALDQREPLCVS